MIQQNLLSDKPMTDAELLEFCKNEYERACETLSNAKIAVKEEQLFLCDCVQIRLEFQNSTSFQEFDYEANLADLQTDENEAMKALCEAISDCIEAERIKETALEQYETLKANQKE
ncbi:MAG: hypothetical protein Unbinned6354contig1000_25 [Prokaryotic dsDNA virus sp.]|nr:hypothetical protein [Cytophagaceae bacterium]QDP54322.1 MAG: hypothetical protein Unbinned6354contig1000_25 [Prokaryotic dsDNA virus sp.]|tara:strand:+ start:3534 stop:3881 length:348 start_codon:yes stop_codon:yes gene_type:complete